MRRTIINLFQIFFILCDSALSRFLVAIFIFLWQTTTNDTLHFLYCLKLPYRNPSFKLYNYYILSLMWLLNNLRIVFVKINEIPFEDFFLIDVWTKKLDYIEGASTVWFSIFEVNFFIKKIWKLTCYLKWNFFFFFLKLN